MANGTTYQKTTAKSGKLNPKVKPISKKKYDKLSKRYAKKGDTASTKETHYTFKSKTNKKGITKTKVVSKPYRESVPLVKTPKIPTR